MADRFYVIVPADTIRSATFHEALAKAKRFAALGADMAVLEALAIAQPDGSVVALEKVVPTEDVA